jgi:hypothetical protein
LALVAASESLTLNYWVWSNAFRRAFSLCAVATHFARHPQSCWLDPAITDAAELQPLLDAYPAAEMLATPVSTHVNNVRNNDEGCIAPMAEQELL